MNWKCGDCCLNGLPPRPFLSVKARNYLCRWQRTTNPDMIHRHKWRMCRQRSRAKTENAVYGGSIYHRNEIHEKQKVAPTDGFTKIIRRKFFFLTVYCYLCNKQSAFLKWQNKVKYRSSLVSWSLPSLIDNQTNLLVIWYLQIFLCFAMW